MPHIQIPSCQCKMIELRGWNIPYSPKKTTNTNINHTFSLFSKTFGFMVYHPFYKFIDYSRKAWYVMKSITSWQNNWAWIHITCTCLSTQNLKHYPIFVINLKIPHLDANGRTQISISIYTYCRVYAMLFIYNHTSSSKFNYKNLGIRCYVCTNLRTSWFFIAAASVLLLSRLCYYYRVVKNSTSLLSCPNQVSAQVVMLQKPRQYYIQWANHTRIHYIAQNKAIGTPHKYICYTSALESE